MIKKTRLYVGISLVVQAFSFLIMFLILCTKKKSVAAAFLAVAAMQGAAGAYLLYQEKGRNSAIRGRTGERLIHHTSITKNRGCACIPCIM